MEQINQEPVKKIGKFKISKMMVKESWNLFKQDKEMMLFPILSTITSLFIIGIIFLFFFFFSLGGSFEALESYGESQSSVDYIYLFIIYFLSFFVALFFQAGVLGIAHGRLNNRDLGFKDGMTIAFSKIGKIFVWSVVAASVGVILRFLSERVKLVGKIVIGIMGAAWGILTFFIAPILILDDLSLKDSLKKSAFIIKKTWGETIIINVGMGLYFAFLGFLGVIVFILSLFTANPIIIIGMLILLVIYLILLAVVSSTLSIIFKLVLYEYANTGITPQGFSNQVLNSAFKQKK